MALSPVTAGAKLKNAEQLCTRLPATLGLLLEGRISELQARAVTEASSSGRSSTSAPPATGPPPTSPNW